MGYELVEVSVDGVVVYGRPIDGTQADSILRSCPSARAATADNIAKTSPDIDWCMTTCPHCSQLIIFSNNDLYVSKISTSSIICGNCGRYDATMSDEMRQKLDPNLEMPELVNVDDDAEEMSADSICDERSTSDRADIAEVIMATFKDEVLNVELFHIG